MHASFLFHHPNLQLAYTTQAWILKFKNLCHASKHVKCTFKCTIQVHELAPPTCVLKVLIDPFPLSYYSYVKFSPCINITIISLPLFHYLCTLISPPLSSMTTKVQRVGNTICRVEIIKVNQWDEDHFPKFGSN